jgi:Glycosyl transferase family 2
MRNEGAHLEEWLEFHRAVGVTDFLIFNHQSTDRTAEVLRAWEGRGVTWHSTDWDGGEPLQIQNLREAHPATLQWDWMGCIDGDELIVPNAAWTLAGLLEPLPPACDAVVINWLMMGERDAPGTSLLDITRCSDQLERVYKFLARPAALRGYYSVHTPAVAAERVLHDFHRPFVAESYSTDQASGKFAQINHYHWRSPEEFEARKARGWHYQRSPRIEGGVPYWRSHTNQARNDRAREVAQHHHLAGFGVSAPDPR